MREANRLQKQAVRAQQTDGERATAQEANRLQMQATRAQQTDGERAVAQEAKLLQKRAACAKRVERTCGQSARTRVGRCGSPIPAGGVF